jgi:hypothetical protein
VTLQAAAAVRVKEILILPDLVAAEALCPADRMIVRVPRAAIILRFISSPLVLFASDE